MIGISSCLGGICCRYDGKSQEQEALKQLVTNGKAIMICPEVLGELPIPRPPAAVSYTHLRAHETRHDLVCRLLLEKKKRS